MATIKRQQNSGHGYTQEEHAINRHVASSSWYWLVIIILTFFNSTPS